MSLVELIIKEDVATITINKPEAMNALSSSVLKELSEVITQVKDNASIRCVIITGAGEKAFVAGADIKEINSLDKQKAEEFAELGQQTFSDLENLNIPVIAAVNGFALGGGLELALSCDFIFASEKARFGLPECTLGLMPGFGGSVRLARAVGSSMAKQMTFTGDMVGAEQAKTMGLVNEVFAPEELLEGANRVAKTISLRAPLALAAIKNTIQDTYGVERDEAMKMERRAFAELFESEDCQEGTLAFIEKRKPQFKGK